jgi:protein-S-isoprenylcysteine O-methyltransferase Ste14
MYIGVVSVLVAEGIFFRAPAVLAYAVAVLTMFQSFVVLYEEPTLRRHFGPAYDAYCRRVPRWIGRPRS